MDAITHQIKRIQRFVASSTMTKTELARRARLPLTTLIGVENDGWNPKSTTLTALVRALDDFESLGVKKNGRVSRDVASVA